MPSSASVSSYWQYMRNLHMIEESNPFLWYVHLYFHLTAYRMLHVIKKKKDEKKLIHREEEIPDCGCIYG